MNIKTVFIYEYGGKMRTVLDRIVFIIPIVIVSLLIIFFLNINIFFKILIIFVSYFVIANLYRLLPPIIPVKSFTSAMLSAYTKFKKNFPKENEEQILLMTLLARPNWKKLFSVDLLKFKRLSKIDEINNINDLTKHIFLQEYEMHYRKLSIDKFASSNKYIDKYIALKMQDKFDKTTEINPKTEQVWIDKGVALARQYKLNQAIKYFNKAITINPENEKAWGLKGLTLIQQGKPIEAIDCYNKIIELNIENENA